MLTESNLLFTYTMKRPRTAANVFQKRMLLFHRSMSQNASSLIKGLYNYGASWFPLAADKKKINNCRSHYICQVWNKTFNSHNCDEYKLSDTPWFALWVDALSDLQAKDGKKYSI